MSGGWVAWVGWVGGKMGKATNKSLVRRQRLVGEGVPTCGAKSGSP